MNEVKATTEARAVYQEIKRFYNAEGMTKIIPTRGQLRLEQVGGGKNRYQFPVLSDEQGMRPSERRLNRTDAFWVDRVGMYLAKRHLNRADGAGDQPFSAVTPLAWPTPLVFATGAELDAAECLANGGTFSIEVDEIRWVKQFDALRNRFVGNVVGSLIVNEGGSAYAADEWRDDLVMGKMVPTIRLNGGSSNVIEWSVKEAINFSGTAPTAEDPGWENVLIVILDGWYVANAGEFQPARTM